MLIWSWVELACGNLEGERNGMRPMMIYISGSEKIKVWAQPRYGHLAMAPSLF